MVCLRSVPSIRFFPRAFFCYYPSLTHPSLITNTRSHHSSLITNTPFTSPSLPRITYSGVSPKCAIDSLLPPGILLLLLHVPRLFLLLPLRILLSSARWVHSLLLSHVFLYYSVIILLSSSYYPYIAFLFFKSKSYDRPLIKPSLTTHLTHFSFSFG